MGRALMHFQTKEQAVDYCTRHGFQYEVEEPNPRRSTRTKRYADYGMNFSVKRKGFPDMSNFPSNRTK